eukprot:8391688-Pyramimonas_sp.AAC.2
MDARTQSFGSCSDRMIWEYTRRFASGVLPALALGQHLLSTSLSVPDLLVRAFVHSTLTDD